MTNLYIFAFFFLGLFVSPVKHCNVDPWIKAKEHWHVGKVAAGQKQTCNVHSKSIPMGVQLGMQGFTRE